MNPARRLSGQRLQTVKPKSLFTKAPRDIGALLIAVDPNPLTVALGVLGHEKD